MIRKMEERPEGEVWVWVHEKGRKKEMKRDQTNSQETGVNSLCGVVQSFNTIIYSIILELFMLYLFSIDGELLKEEFMSHPCVLWSTW